MIDKEQSMFDNLRDAQIEEARLSSLYNKVSLETLRQLEADDVFWESANTIIRNRANQMLYLVLASDPK